MPTGYTADIYDGKNVSFEDFALNCARGFGALISLRDDPSSEIPDKIKVDEYYVRRAAETKADLEKAENMTDEEFAAEAKVEFSAKKESLTILLKEKQDLRKRYEDMLEQVKEWTPPTEKHVELKNFMISQLEESIRFDASTASSSKELAELTLETVDEVKERIVSSAQWYFDHANKELDKAKATAEENSEWVSNLRKSLKK